MSLSRISLKILTTKGKKYIVEFETDDSTDVNTHDGTFRTSVEEFENITMAYDLFYKAFKWFYESLDDPDFSLYEVDKAFNLYGSGDLLNIKQLTRKEDILSAEIFSSLEYWDEPFGASLVKYNYSTKTLNEEHRDEIPYSDMEDCYGEELYDKFSRDDGEQL